MKELKLVKGEVTYKVDIATLVSTTLNDEEIEEILSDIAMERVSMCDMTDNIDILEDDIKIKLLDRECEEYQDQYLCESEIKELLEKSYERKEEVIEILPGQIGFNI
ncbi:hypothetical protein ACSXD1_04875 [Clostridium perfringens]|uniref:hypothetical protein n=2 Tax=Clostridium perfringens TaxID=1502 RepID=UPI001CC97A5F|nr:hypothetical protein [Clostridium perfringens]EJT6491913.1 hypothetical protein [Clostridium perfringens]MDK0728077.1 hypothetical protein [Clostridium perfringens]UBK89691.1 hypothetical protein KLF51_04735 [Clostridium perfringens]